MKLEQQVVSLEIAKKLKKLGVKQEGLFAWSESSKKYPLLLLDRLRFAKSMQNSKKVESRKEFSAFTVAELGEMLPDAWHSELFEKGWAVPDDEGVIFAYTQTEADARGKMLIYLLENKLMELPK